MTTIICKKVAQDFHRAVSKVIVYVKAETCLMEDACTYIILLKLKTIVFTWS
jgi:hypothetical protein